MQEFASRHLAEEAFKRALPALARRTEAWPLTFEVAEPFGARGAEWSCARCQRSNFGWCAALTPAAPRRVPAVAV